MSAQTKIWGKKLKEKRLESNMTQEQVAKKIGIDRSGVSKIENGIYDFSLETTAKFLEALDLDLTVKNKE